LGPDRKMKAKISKAKKAPARRDEGDEERDEGESEEVKPPPLKKRGFPEIIAVKETAPAGKVGLKRGDIIVSVEGVNDKQGPDLVASELRGAASTKVSFKIARGGAVTSYECTRQLFTLAHAHAGRRGERRQRDRRQGEAVLGQHGGGRVQGCQLAKRDLVLRADELAAG